VSRSDVEDWKKLIRLLSFLKKTKNDARIIGASSLRRLYTWVDASYAVHSDMKGQTGSATSFGLGIIGSKSTKQKINTKSSTESELVGASEYLPYCIWYLYFLEKQGFDLEDNILFQDNKSAILMERNGRNSCTGNSRHINIRYFFIKDRIKNKEVSVMYCPTEMMLADYFTKPLQGSLFNKFRSVIMGYTDMSSVFPPKVSGSEERVGKSIQSKADHEKVSEKSNEVLSKPVKSKNSSNAYVGKLNSKNSNPTYAQVVKRGASTEIASSSKNQEKRFNKRKSSSVPYVRTPVPVSSKKVS